ncbi:hypothetical protein [Arthrobacter sp. ISL-69]|uniref:hypothetical protein n=1 Tax=Arthrobacter sp. ISL-69 TaxID=2819113 RepID=UPI001BEC8911|nr:hypothetical protein [Arthrobacter sp. ISL-69]MBT2535131.1 hypothetical protein [Arthrobacter sp. ISL-69]
MPDNSRVSKAVKWSVLIAVGILLTVGVGLLINWQLAPFVFLLYFVGGWAADRAQRKKKDTDADRADWPNKRRGSGSDTGGKANGSSETPPL